MVACLLAFTAALAQDKGDLRDTGVYDGKDKEDVRDTGVRDTGLSFDPKDQNEMPLETYRKVLDELNPWPLPPETGIAGQVWFGTTNIRTPWLDTKTGLQTYAFRGQVFVQTDLNNVWIEDWVAYDLVNMMKGTSQHLDWIGPQFYTQAVPTYASQPNYLRIRFRFQYQEAPVSETAIRALPYANPSYVQNVYRFDVFQTYSTGVSYDRGELYRQRVVTPTGEEWYDTWILDPEFHGDDTQAQLRFEPKPHDGLSLLDFLLLYHPFPAGTKFVQTSGVVGPVVWP